ncbi:MAG: bifunctional diaminohydroxyphosphoribosylaminopyrimidine deaminase/5-amino-6-(5-phosphoribosylamino)uracil reductase RibD [Flavobacteriaceae bacterium]|nr:bifunctional diaminohydroxyphosphoribosylaminopyrimidine deaminase/5-amino-6-(5-phosphoribosylamino)uracil reductase RibD [Flavobacteriaceae bacterium]
MQRCLILAKNGLGTTQPNPMVGSVIVHDDVIIGEGYTSVYGGNHAEVNAINSVKDKSLLKSATIYMSLEPCSHHGKTPPCADLIIKSRIPKVVVGVVDDNSLVNGKGIERLRENSCEVIVGVLKDECKKINKRFFTFHNKKRPYIILKWAETKDGFIAPERNGNLKNETFLQNDIKPIWISNKISQQLVHKWRSEEQSILVGTNTVISDNPRLNVRKWIGQNPVRLVLDNSLRIPHNFHVFDGSVKTIVFTSSKAMFEKEKENILLEYIDYSKSIPQQICDKLVEYNIQSIIVEGGAKILQSFIYDDLWDEARVFIGDTTFSKGLKAPKINGVLEKIQEIDSDILKLIKPIN